MQHKRLVISRNSVKFYKTMPVPCPFQLQENLSFTHQQINIIQLVRYSGCYLLILVLRNYNNNSN